MFGGQTHTNLDALGHNATLHHINPIGVPSRSACRGGVVKSYTLQSKTLKFARSPPFSFLAGFLFSVYSIFVQTWAVDKYDYKGYCIVFKVMLEYICNRDITDDKAK